MRTYNFRPRSGILLVKETAQEIEKAISEGRSEIQISLDLGLSKSLVKIEGNHAIFPDGSRIDIERIKKIESGDVCLIEDNEVFKLAFYSQGRYYRLLSVGPSEAPTLEVSGIHMHRIKYTTPWKDSLEKIKAVRVFDGARVLDIGTGLGYTAIIAHRWGGDVLSIEVDENVLRMAEANPWSRELSSPGIEIVLGDAVKVVKELPESSFHRVVHDPPRFALAGELYSKSFYQELFRVMKPRGRIYHYVGDPGKWRRKRLVAGVIKRLKEVGFVRLKQMAAGVVAEKP